MDFSAEAEAYDNRFPAITKVVLRKGAVEFNPVTPPADITLLATSAVLVVRKEMHPALRSLLTHTVISHPKSGFDKAGDPVLLYRAGDFPSASDPEFQVPPEARAIYKTGELPVLLRTLLPVSARLGLPFSFTAFVSSYGGQALLVLIPIAALVIPFSRTVPAVYAWMVRRRLFYWYQQLKALERSSGHPRCQAGRDGAAGRAGAHRRGGQAHPGAAALLKRALRPARPYRSRAPAALHAVGAEAGGGVAALTGFNSGA